LRSRTPEWLWRVSIQLNSWGFKPIAKLTKIANYLLHRTLLPVEAVVGERVRLEHYALGIVMHPNVSIGDDVRIYHHVTIAGEMPLDAPERVVIGNRVTIGVNAVIMPSGFRGLSIGDDAVIGAGAVVTKDVPPRAIMVGVPARVLRYRDNEEIANPYGVSLQRSRDAGLQKGIETK